MFFHFFDILELNNTSLIIYFPIFLNYILWIIGQIKPFFLIFDMFPPDSIQLPKVLENDLDDLGDRARDIAHRGGNYHKHVLEADRWKEAVQGYLASIAYCDAMLGRLLDALENSRFASNTIIVLWSDHGWQLGEKDIGASLPCGIILHARY
ncbi:hypothetical protein ES708_27690 [subsurface metagenome]